MPDEELKNELKLLLDNSRSIQTLPPMKRGALKDKMLSLPEKKMRQAIEQLKDEMEKLTAVGDEILALTTEAKNQTKSMQTVIMKEQRKKEAVESGKQSEEILNGLKKEGSAKKKKRLPILIMVALASIALLAVLKYFNYF